jgi:PAP2 superfamily
LHVGWALWCAWVVFLCSRSRWLRTLVTTYAAGTVLVVIGTGNHYLLDAVGGTAVLALGVVATRPRGPGPAPVGTVTSVPVTATRKPAAGALAAAVDGPGPLDSRRARA